MKPKRSKEYKKMMRKYKKSIRTKAKEMSQCPWDYGYAVDIFMEYVRFMRDFYTLGENVWQVEESKNEIIESLNKVLSLYEDLEKIDDKYIVFCERDDIEKYLKQGFHLQREQPTMLNHYYLTLLEDIKENTRALNREYNEIRHDIFRIIERDIKKWWD